MSEQICKKIPKHQMGNVVSPKGIKTPRVRFKEAPATNQTYPKKRVGPIPKKQEGGLINRLTPRLGVDPKRIDPEMINVDKYNTPLTSEEQTKFSQWAKEQNKAQKRDIMMDKGAYDVQGFWKYDRTLVGGHGFDTWKKPNHPTFSNQSKYHGANGIYGGSWGKDGSYFPSRQTRQLYDEDYHRWMFKREPGRKEHLDLSKSTEHVPSIYQQGGVLGKILSYYPGTALQMALAKKFTSRIADNMYPYSYENPARRIVSAGILGRKHFKDTGIPYMDEALHERQDLLHMLLNKKTHNGAITESPYKPTKAEDPNTKYYRSPFVEKAIREQLAGKESFGKEQLENNIANAGGIVLGNYSTNRGKDDKGDYISYYDKWDLNPIPKTRVDWIDKTVDKVVTGIPQALGLTTTPEIYGRVYLDPETGKPTQKPKLRKGGKI